MGGRDLPTRQKQDFDRVIAGTVPSSAATPVSNAIRICTSWKTAAG